MATSDRLNRRTTANIDERQPRRAPARPFRLVVHRRRRVGSSRPPKPSPIRESRTTLDGVRTRVLEVAGDGPPILLLHGFSDSADTWRPVLEALEAQSRRGIAVDLPCFGAASRLSRGPLLTRFDRFTAAFVRQYGRDEPVILAGNSLGGLLTLRAGQGDDLPLLAVAGIGPAGLSYTPRFEDAFVWLRRLRPALQVVRVLPVPTSVVRSGVARAYDARLAQGRADPELAWRFASHFDSMRDVHRLFPIMLTLSEESRDDPLRLDQIDVPVALLLGARDPLVPVSAGRVLLDVIPHAHVAVFEDCGHCPQVQRPDDVASLLAALPVA